MPERRHKLCVTIYRFSLNTSIILAIKDPKIVIPAQAGISSRTVGVCQKIPASAGMTVVFIFGCPINDFLKLGDRTLPSMTHRTGYVWR